MEKITSTQNKRILEIAKLKTAKFRKESGLFCAEGIKLTLEVISCSYEIVNYFILENANITQFEPDFDKTVIVSENVMKKISSMTTCPEIITVAKQMPSGSVFTDDDFILALDAIQDPTNLGAILRSAEAFGVKTVLLGNGCCDAFSSKALRCSMGSILRLNTLYTDLSVELSALKKQGYTIIGTGLDRDYRTVDKLCESSKKAVVIGNEGNGISEQIKSICDFGMFIPMYGQNESLNAAVAASIIMWENKRQIEHQ